MALDDLLKTKSEGSLSFPSDFGVTNGNWMLYTRYKYNKSGITTEGVREQVGRPISLPLPPQLSASYNAEWSNIDLGISGNYITGVVGGVANKIKKNLDKTGSISQSVLETLKQTGTGLGNTKNVLQGLYDYGKNAAIDAITDTDIAQKAGLSLGYARNPHKAVVYNASNFRNFNFNYRLIAKNLDEANAIRAIIREFKIGMAPALLEQFQNNIYDYPDMFQIQFIHNAYLFNIAMCVLRDITVEYHSEGAPIYFNSPDGTKIPASLTLSLTFQELEIMTRENFENGGF